MTAFRYLLSLAFVALAAAAASGQYGLYGSPDLVQLPTGASAPPVSTASYAVPALPPLVAQPQPQPGWHQPQPQPQPGWHQPQPQPHAGWHQPQPQPQPAYAVTRQPLLRPAPAVPQHAVPQYAVPQYAMPRHASPGMVQPHPAVAHRYTPEPPRPVEQLQQAIPVPPSPPGMSDPSPSPSDAYLPAPAANGHVPSASGPSPSTGSYLDYDPGWGHCNATSQAFAGYGAPYDCGAGCDAFGACSTGCRKSRWYAGATALFLGRNDANRLWTTYEDGNEPNQLMHSDMIGLKWRAGGEVKFGRRFGCCGEGPWALQASYFTIEPFYGFRSMMHANGVSTTLTVRELRFNGADARDWFDGAAEHRLWRRNELHNVELSLVRSSLPWTYGTRFDCDFELGVRYFRFWEQLTFGTRRAGASWTQLAHTAFLDDQVTNNLAGFQFGANMGYHFHPSCRIFVAPKVGIYNNYVDHYFIARLGDGTVATVTGPAGESFPVRASTNALSFLTQIDMGLDWQLTQRFSAQIGYRVIVATGMALADHQIPHYVNDIPEYRNIKTNGELILHGAFAGLTFNY